MTATAPEASPRVTLQQSDVTPDLSPSESFRGWHFAVLIGITLLGALLRFYKLEVWSFWVDEAHTWRDVTMPLPLFHESARGWYPLSYLGLRGVIEMGLAPMLTEGWLRLPFALFGIASIPMLAFFGHMLVGRRAALLAALFLAINPWHIYWSQNARAYVLVFFFAVLSAGMFWMFVQRRSWWCGATSIAAMLVAGGCHFTALALMPVFLAYRLLSRRELTMRQLLVGMAIAIAVALALPSMLALMPPMEKFIEAKPDASLVHYLQTTAWYFRLPLLCAAGLGAWLLQVRTHGKGLFLVCWAIIPLFLLGIVSVDMVKVTARYALCALPAIILLAASGSVRLAEVLSRGLGYTTNASRAIPVVVLPAILCFDMVAYDVLYFTSQHGDRGRYREAAQAIKRAAGDDLMTVMTVNEPSFIYYLLPDHFRGGNAIDRGKAPIVIGMDAWSRMPTAPGSGPGKATEDSFFAEPLAICAREGRRLFVAVTLPEFREKDRDGSIQRELEQRFERIADFPCWVGPKDETIYVYRVRD